MDAVKKSIQDKIVASCLNGDARGFDAGTDLQRTGILDSFSTLSLVAFIDETFNVQLEAVDIHADTFKSVTTIAELVTSRLLGKK